MRKPLTLLGMAALLLLVAAAALPATAAPNVCRDLPSGDQTEGAEITVTLDVTVDGAEWYLIDEEIPAGLTVVDAGGASTATPGHLKWSVSTGATDTTYTYTVQGSAGSYTFSGEYNMQGMSTELPIDCDTGLEIEGDAIIPSATTVESPDGGESTGGVVITTPAATPTETGTQPVAGETVTSAPSVTPTESMTPAATSTKKLATKPDAAGMVSGFGALFAVAGLLAVAYMRRRR